MEGTLMSKNDEFEEVLRFWFSSLPTGDHAAMTRQMEWWFRGGADAEIIERFSPLLAQAFFFLPLGHSEKLANLERAVNPAEELIKDAPQEHRGMLEFSANQARGHRDVIVRFGRHPHRNELLGQQSTPEEL